MKTIIKIAAAAVAIILAATFALSYFFYRKNINEALYASLKIYAELDSVYNTSSASGVIFSMDEENAYILTNYHVLYYSSKISDNITCRVYGDDETSVACTYLVGSAADDVAVLRASAAEFAAISAGVRAADLSFSYKAGDTVVAIGNPNNEGITSERGKITAESTEITLTTNGAIRTINCIEVNAKLYQGSSGGGLFNRKGQLIGVVNAIDQNSSTSYAIPLSTAMNTVNELLGTSY